MTSTPLLKSVLVYINGIETPVKGATVSYGVWSPPTASIDMVPDVTLRDIGREDRVRVTIFYLDSVYKPKGLSKVVPTWCLMFDGEIQRVSFNASKSGTNMQIQCADLINGLQHMRMFFMMSISNLVTQNTTAGIPDNPNSAITGHHFAPTFPASLFYQGLDTTKNTPITRPYDLIDNMFRALVSPNEFPPALLAELSKNLGREVTPAEARSTASMHWFARWARKNEFLRRWSALPIFESKDSNKKSVFPILRSIQSQQSIAAITQMANRINDSGSLYDIIQTLFSSMYYELQMLPTAPAVRQDYVSGDILGPMTSETNKETKTPLDRRYFRLLQNVSKPQVLFGVPPACNVIWPSIMTSLAISTDYSQRPTRTVISEGNLFTVLNAGSTEQTLGDFINTAMAVAFPPMAQEQMDRRLGRSGYPRNVLANPHNYLVYPEEFFRGPQYSTRSIPPWFMFLQNSAAAPDDKNSDTTADKDVAEAGTPALSQDRYNGIKIRGLDFITENLPFYQQQTTQQARFRAARLLEIQNRLNNTPTEPGGDIDNIELGRRWLALAQLLYGTIDEDASERWPNTVGMLSDIDAIRSSINDLLANQPAYQLYVAYEHYRSQYQLTSVSCSTIFNPYVVPGYPAVVFDRNTTQQHQASYVVNVDQVMQPGNFSTSISLSFSRPFSEFFRELYSWRNREDGRVDTSIQINGATEFAGDVLPAAFMPILRAVDDPKLTQAAYDAIVAKSTKQHQKDIASLSPNDRFNETARFNVLVGRAFTVRSGASRDELDAVPPNPIPEIRKSFQTNREADRIYRAALYTNNDQGVPVEAHFDMNTVVAYSTNGGGSSRSGINSDVLQKEKINPKDFIEQAVCFRPSDAHMQFNDDPDAAMRYVSRPVCTLEEWIDLHERGVRQGEVSAEDASEAKGAAKYYVKILDLVPGPGSRPAISETGDVLSTIEVDTRYNWENLLLRYRDRVYYELTAKKV